MCSLLHPRLILLTSVAMLLSSLASCREDVFITNVQNYRFVVAPKTETNVRIIRNLFYTFNQEMGEEVLYLVQAGETDDRAAVSSILFERDTAYRSKIISSEHFRTVGSGNWLRLTHTQRYRSFFYQPHALMTQVYTMQLRFNADYFINWYLSSDSQQRALAYTLFLHELGHGMRLRHVNKQAAVMYPQINAVPKDYSDFYAKVRTFLRQ